MDIYDLKNNNLEIVKQESFGLEKDIQNLIENNLDLLFNLEFVSTEFSIGDFRLDTLCYDNENNSFVIIEYKKGSSYSVIDQGYSYMSIMLNNKSDFILEYNEKKDKNLKRTEIDWSQSRIIFISPSFNSYQKNSVNFKDVPFELWEIRKFSNNTISLNELRSSSKESIQKVESGKNKIISDVNQEISVLTEEESLTGKNVSDEVRKVYYSIKEKVSSWEGIEFSCKKNYIGLKKGHRNFVFLNFRKNYIRVHILSQIKVNWDGSKSTKKPFVLDDPKNIFSTWENDYKKLYSLDLNDTKNIDYFILMIKQKYDSV